MNVAEHFSCIDAIRPVRRPLWVPLSLSLALALFFPSAAQAEIAMIKVIAPKMLLAVIDRAIQAHGGAGVSQDFGLAYAWARSRIMRIVDGPDEVHKRAIARVELRK